jgi:pimeloyl-ACP methyl ester carboxylesterase
MATFVLVPGAWLGGWAWDDVTERLRVSGHQVYPVTLPGLGERADEATPETDLEAYIGDVLGLIERDDLRNVALVGHSYAGIVVTGVADRIPDRMSHLVYAESGPLPGDASYLDSSSPEARELAERLVREQGEGWRYPMPSWEDLEGVMGASLAGLGDEERRSMRARSVPQPWATVTQPLTLQGGTPQDLPKVLITSSFPLHQVRELIDEGHPWFRALAGPEWRFFEVPTGHWPMFSESEALAGALDDAVRS